jgi:hypothetical protein
MQFCAWICILSFTRAKIASNWDAPRSETLILDIQLYATSIFDLAVQQIAQIHSPSVQMYGVDLKMRSVTAASKFGNPDRNWHCCGERSSLMQEHNRFASVHQIAAASGLRRYDFLQRGAQVVSDGPPPAG